MWWCYTPLTPYQFDLPEQNSIPKTIESITKIEELTFEYYDSLKEGKFLGKLISTNSKEGSKAYSLKITTDEMFAKVHGDMMLNYTVYENQKIVMLDTITPEDILTEGHQKELTTYKGVMVSKTHADKDMFKINLLNMLEK